jgi:hypothetical protein
MSIIISACYVGLRVSHLRYEGMKKQFVAACVGVVSLNFALSAQPAQASWADAGQFLNDNWGALVSNLWSPWNKQVYMTSLSPQETRDVQRQYQSRADGVLNARCIDRVADTYYTGWRNTAIKTAYRWVVASRIENGQTNCYMRMPNAHADAFIKRRGW